MRISESIHIAASKQKVWDVVMNPHLLHEWVTIHHSLERLSQGPVDTGFSFDQILAFEGIRFRVHWQLITSEPPNYAVWKGNGQGGAHSQITYALVEDDSGSTRFDYENEFSVPGGLIGALVERTLAQTMSEREARKSLALLKEFLET